MKIALMDVRKLWGASLLSSTVIMSDCDSFSSGTQMYNDLNIHRHIKILYRIINCLISL